MKHSCKMNTVVLKSFNDRQKIATVSALMADFPVRAVYGICGKPFGIGYRTDRSEYHGEWCGC